jgi:divalent metal cation (Fe/Co/Zn/Cd) transporter
MSTASESVLLRRGLVLEYVTLSWNVVGVGVLAVAAIAARSVALAGFGLDSLIEIFASTVVVWELKASATADRERRALRLIGIAFLALACYIAAQASYVLIARAHPLTSRAGIAWTAVTCAVMLGLASGKYATGRTLDNAVLRTEGKVTLVDAYLAAAVLIGLLLNATLRWWWADPVAGLVIVFYGIKEGIAALRSGGASTDHSKRINS